MGMKSQFVEGFYDFVDYAMTLEPFQLDGLIKHPCKKELGRPLTQDEVFKVTHTKKKKKTEEDEEENSRDPNERKLSLQHALAYISNFIPGLEGSGSSHDDGLMRQGTILTMEQKITDSICANSKPHC
ncbi:hypothetical protein HAX54_047400 [Datura stramonium]|uniref:DNA-directed RNA polymerase n=1 Tax=Datura stramonium TaxID=4076 RepID=A0ABS8WK64_DATST|nr:hypothetical protein [Datura stramonium]